MHKNEDFCIKNITKIEGHANLDLKVRGGKVDSCEFRVTESHRFFEDMVKGRHFSQVPLIVSRICGLCSSSHLTTATEAIEDALQIQPTEQAMFLREASLFGEFIKSHALHLYMLVLPDYLGKESVLQFEGNQLELVKDALAIKKAGTDILTALGGRPHHTVNHRPGYVTRAPNREKVENVLNGLRSVRDLAAQTVLIFDKYSKKQTFERKTNFVALKGDDYPLMNGRSIHCSDGTVLGKNELSKHIKEFVVPYSTAKNTEFNGKDYVVGALARIALNSKQLHPKAKEIMDSCETKLPNHCPFSTNLAQAIELVHCVETAIDHLDGYEPHKAEWPDIQGKDGNGIGVTEAPRGLLYHTYDLNADGFVTDSNMVIPTQQNIRSIELDLNDLVPTILSMPKPKAELEMEKLIRSYDPCISCSVHFLKVNWL